MDEGALVGTLGFFFAAIEDFLPPIEASA